MALGLDEEDEYNNLDCDSKDQGYDSKLALQALLHRHAELESNLIAIALPQPLGSNIQALAQQVGLNRVECALLAFTVLIHTDRMLGNVAYWLGRELEFPKIYHALSVLLGYSEAEIRQALSTRSTLAKTGMVKLDRHRPNDLKHTLDLLSDGFAEKILTEQGSPLDWLRDMVAISPAPQLALSDYPHIGDNLEMLIVYLKHSLLSKRKGVNVLIYGAPGTGKTQLTRVVADQLGMPLYEITSEDEDGDPVDGERRLRACQSAQAFFAKASALMVFDEAEDVFNDGNDIFGKQSTAQTRKAWMNRMLEANTAPTFWLGNRIRNIDPAFIRRFDWVLELPVPPKSQRERIIRTTCGSVLGESDIKRLTACEELAPAVVTRAAQVVNTLTGAVPTERLAQAMQVLIDKTLIAQGHEGLQTEKKELLPEHYDPALLNCSVDLSQIAIQLKQHGNARLCLYGPSGTGKTAFARWLAKQLDKPLHVRRGADLLSMWVGGTEQNIAHVFKAAEEEVAVLLIDEVDSFLYERSQSRRSWEVTAVNQMLTCLETYNGLFIATTNRMDELDHAAMRRFDIKLEFGFLKTQQAWSLLKSICLALGMSAPDESLKNSLQKLDGLTHGDFAVLERQHRFNPFCDASAMITALEAECALKTPHKRQAIGFV